jgi:hypothetical protein
MLDEFILFSNLINERILDGAHMSEDNVRYSYFLSANQVGKINHTDIYLEYPHPNLPGKEIDSYIIGDSYPKGVAIEFKYDRSNPGGTNQNRTQRAGSFLADLFRLNLVPTSTAEEKYFVYLTDKEMASYFLNPQNKLSRLYNLNYEQDYLLDIDLVNSLAKSASNQVKNLVSPCRIQGFFKKDLVQGHQLRVLSVCAAL